MIKKFIARILKKPIYRSSVIIVDDNFTATFDSDCIFKSIKWVLHGINESAIINKKENTNVFGKISEFKILSFTKTSIGFLCYTKPKPSDFLFMSNNMIYIPETILNIAKNADLKIDDIIKK